MPESFSPLFLCISVTFFFMPHIGLLFGSFNPIHIGHLALANYMHEMQGLDEVWLVVSPQNPFKDTSELIDSTHRVKMAQMAIDGHAGYRVCDVELSMPVPSYTIDTLTLLKSKYPDCTFSLIMGTDIIQSIAGWRNGKEIVDQYRMYVYPRPGYEMPVTDHLPNVIVTNAPMMDVSSTFIRQQLHRGKSMCFFLPQGVEGYIREHGLYQ